MLQVFLPLYPSLIKPFLTDALPPPPPDLTCHMTRGRHSIVRRVLEKHTGKEFAAKFTQVREECDKDFFRQELDALVRQTGQNVQRLHDAYETQRQLILVLESYPLVLTRYRLVAFL